MLIFLCVFFLCLYRFNTDLKVVASINSISNLVQGNSYRVKQFVLTTSVLLVIEFVNDLN